MPLKFKHKIENGVSKVHWHGSIDEDWDSSVNELSTELKDNAEFYFTNIDTLNSIGIRMWTQFIEEVSSNRKIKYFECPSLIMRVLSISNRFLGNASLESFYVTFDCPECDAEIAVKFDTEQGISAIHEEAANQKCRSCGQPMEFQEDPGIYEEIIQKPASK